MKIRNDSFEIRFVDGIPTIYAADQPIPRAQAAAIAAALAKIYTPAHYVYVACCDGAYKVGHSTDPAARGRVLKAAIVHQRAIDDAPTRKRYQASLEAAIESQGVLVRDEWYALHEDALRTIIEHIDEQYH